MNGTKHVTEAAGIRSQESGARSQESVMRSLVLTPDL
jgi:hypothetical protein